MYNKTIEESCSSKSLAVSVIDFKSVERLKTFLSKHATNVDHFFYFLLTNSTTHFYEYDSHFGKIYEKNGTIVKNSKVCCIKRGYTITQIIGIFLGTIFALVIFVCTIKFIVSRKNKTVSFGVNFVNNNLIK